MKTAITELLHIEYPIFQGGMAWVAEHTLAAAVSNAGGLGIVASGGAPCDWVREEIRKTKTLTDKPFGVNIMLMNPEVEAIAQMVVEEGVSVVTTGAGNPEKYFPLWKAAGIKIIPVVASAGLARRMEKYGADAVIAEGYESGGHIGEQTTMALVPQVVRAVNLPVLAAGGIGDGKGVAAAFMLGAEGIQVGTRFLLADETQIHENYKEKVVKAKDIDSQVTGRSTGHPVRQLRNPMTRKYLKMEAAGASLEELERMTLGSLRKAVMEGDMEEGSFMAGQIAGLVDKRQSCKEIIEEMMQEAADIIQEQAKRFTK
jgi:enoyl-[acyl-carrier protein] reductase II